MFKIGINSNNESGKNDTQILKNIKQAGFENIMLSFKSSEVENSIKTANELGLKVQYFHLDGHFSDYLWTKGEMAIKTVNKLISQIELCAKYNIPIAIFHPSYGTPSSKPFRPNIEGIKNITKILEVAKKHNVKIALENLDRYSCKLLNYLLKNIKDENLGFCYDCGHHHLYNPKDDLLKKYGNRLFALHLHDNLMDWSYGYDHSRDLHMLPFDGTIDFDKVCHKLKKINYQGIIMLEVHKVSFPTPMHYEKLSDTDFLNEAKTRANRLLDILN